MRKVRVELGSVEYEIVELTTRKAEAWRQNAGAPLQDILALIRANKELTGDALSELISTASDLLLGSLATIKELLFAYSPELQARRDEIEDTAYDSEIVTAFVEVLKLAFPFGSLVSTLTGLMQRDNAVQKPGSVKQRT